MAFTSREILRLKKIAAAVEQLLADDNARSPRNGRGKKRLRRTGKALAAFRRQLKAERKKGMPVAEIARKHGVSSAYVYMLP